MYFVIAFLTPQAFYTANAFLIGAIVSIISGSVGMAIATSANYRTTFAAKKSLPLAFKTAYRAGVAMGFALVSLGLLGTHCFNKFLSY
jgi:K(+)-stimulated pyrophosphate-energized sodium pump